MNRLITINNEELRLNSFLTENAYGKTNYEQVLSQCGVYFDGEHFEDWSFSDIKALDMEGYADRYVHYIGKNPLSDKAEVLTQAIESEDKEHSFKAGLIICKAITTALEKRETLPVNGAGGILVDISTDSALFLPGELFKYAASALSPADYAANHNLWINPTLIEMPALCFERANLSYKMITGNFPFDNMDLTERNADILDGKFIPVELAGAGVEKDLAKVINNSLYLNANVIADPSKKFHGKTFEELKPRADFPLELLEKWFSKDKTESEAEKNIRLQQIETFEKNLYPKIKTKRFLRRNVAKIATIAAIAVILAFLMGNYIITRQKELSSLGLTSTQTVEAFFMGVNDKDTSLLDNIADGKSVNGYIDTISQLYVIGKQRQAYFKVGGLSSMARWLFEVDSPEVGQKAGLYSACDVRIDGKPVNLDVQLFAKKDRPKPITEEGGIQLVKNSQSVHKVEYYLAYTDGENNDIQLSFIKSIFTLTYKGKRWIITSMETNEENLEFNSDEFKNSYYERLKANDYDVLKSVKQLRFNYSWLPSDKMMEAEKIEFEKSLENPFGF